jgi:hypothetical protein
MGIACTRPRLVENTDVVRQYLANPEMVDYPRAAAAFEQIGSHEYAVLCWLAAGRPQLAERVYERGGLTILDNRFGDTPIWRMIILTRMDEFDKVEKYKHEYLIARNHSEWVARIVAAI